MLIKYIKSVLLRLAKLLSYIEDVGCLKINGLLNAVTTVMFNVISYKIRVATVCLCQLILYAAVVMKDKKEERQRGSKLQDYGLLSCDAV